MEYCCEDLKHHSETPCDSFLPDGKPFHHDRYECPDALIDRYKNGTTGIIIHDGGTSMVIINYCPWCGTALEPTKSVKKPT